MLQRQLPLLLPAPYLQEAGMHDYIHGAEEITLTA